MHLNLGAFAALSEPYSVFYKGDGRPDYSGFQGFNIMGLDLENALSISDITEVDICGIAGDYCVKQTALDAVREGIKVNIIERLVASVGGEGATRDMIDEVAEAQE
jgi:nicotinamidase/pyrazinamidase